MEPQGPSTSREPALLRAPCSMQGGAWLRGGPAPASSLLTCWSPLLVFSVALTGFGILHKANEAVIKVFVTLPYLHVSAAVWGQLISPPLTQKESF